VTDSSNSHAHEDSELPLKPNKNKQSLILLFVVFALPIILAKFALDQNWLNTGVTNQGVLLTEQLTVKDLEIDQTKFSEQWLIIYLLPEHCLKNCQKTLETVHNSYVVLGKDMPRITPLLLKNHQLSPEENKRILASQWQVTQISEQAKAKLSDSQILIADPLGNIILSYDSMVTSQQLEQNNPQSNQQTLLGKAIIADMKKLLKYSKVG
jgi:hypothetical protein